MVEIIIQGDDRDSVAPEVKAAIHEIFGIEPLSTHRGGSATPGSRDFVTAALIALAIPPALTAGRDVVRQLDLSGRWNRFIGKAAAAAKDKKATILLDTGHGKPIPLHTASQEQIREALKALETHLKS